MIRNKGDSAIYIFGDTHGIIDIEKVFLIDESYKQNDFIIICGDFGVIWGDEIDSNESILIKEFKKLPCEILFIDGNHENFNRLANILTMGGAKSIDKAIKSSGFFGHWHSDFDFNVEIENALDSTKTLRIHAHLLYDEIFCVRK